MRVIPALKHGGATNLVPTRVVIHCTVSPCRKGGAVGTAYYFQSPTAGGSAHLVADPCEVVRCLSDNIVAYHAPPNTHSLGIELTDPMDGNAARWHDVDHVAMMRLAAPQVARWCALYKIPITKLSVDDLEAGARGICSHVDVSQAFHKSDHWDPGPQFPWPTFIELVKQADSFPPSKGTDMTPAESKQLAEALTQASQANMRSAANANTLAGLAVSDAYRRILGREADPKGYAFWVNQIVSGRRTVDQVLQAIEKAAA